MRTLVWLLSLCAALSACNMAVSDHPMLAGEPRSPLELKDGVWLAEDKDCKVNTERPARRWPKCADWFLIRQGKIVGAPGAKPGELPVDIIIADGQPPLLEFPLKEEDETTAKGYAYIALEAVRFDPVGAATELRLWPVACGVEEHSEGVQDNIRHFPGMDKDCHPASVAVLRTAAAAGPQGQGDNRKKGGLRWVRARAN